MGYKVSEGLCLDTAGTDGLTTEVSQTMTAFGRKIFLAEAAIGAAQVRLHYSLTGSGKAILDAYMVASDQ